MTNCKNCGAPLTGGKCEYCGTEYDTFSRAPINPRIYPRSINSYEDMEQGVTTLYADNQPIMRVHIPTADSLWLDELLSARETRGVLYR